MIYIGLFSRTATEADLLAFFSSHGVSVDSVEVKRDEYNGKTRRFAIAQSSDPAAVIAACNGQDLNGFPVVVREVD